MIGGVIAIVVLFVACVAALSLMLDLVFDLCDGARGPYMATAFVGSLVFGALVAFAIFKVLGG